MVYFHREAQGLYNVCCHPRRPDNRSNPIRNPTDLSNFKKLKVFDQHPDSTASCVLKFSVNMTRATTQFHEFEVSLREIKKKISKSYIQNAMIRYDLFMKLKKKYPDAYLVPTLDIEIIWVSHLLRPHSYHSDCQKIYGKVFDHRLECTKFEKTIRSEAIIETEKLWKSEYKSDYFFQGKPEIPTKRYEMGSRMVEDRRESKYYHFEYPLNMNPKVNQKELDSLGFSFNEDDVLQDRNWIDDYTKFMNGNRSIFDAENYIRNTHGFIKSYERFL